MTPDINSRTLDIPALEAAYAKIGRHTVSPEIGTVLDAAPELIKAAKERDALKIERDNARFKLGIYADESEISGMSWSGFNVIGDKKSIREIQRIENRSSQLSVYQKEFDNRLSALANDIASLRALLAEAGEALEPFTCSCGDARPCYMRGIKQHPQDAKEECTQRRAATTLAAIQSALRDASPTTGNPE